MRIVVDLRRFQGYAQGVPLPRLEVNIALEIFLRRVENPRLVVDPPPDRQSDAFRGPRHLLIEIDGIRD